VLRCVVFELSYGKPAETVEVEVEQLNPLWVGEMTAAERGVLKASALEMIRTWSH